MSWILDRPAIAELLASGSLALQGVGRLQLKHYEGYVGRDPATGGEIKVAPTQQLLLRRRPIPENGLVVPAAGPTAPILPWDDMGIFVLYDRPAHEAWNPQTGQNATVPGGVHLRFAPSAALKAALANRPLPSKAPEIGHREPPNAQGDLETLSSPRLKWTRGQCNERLVTFNDTTWFEDGVQFRSSPTSVWTREELTAVLTRAEVLWCALGDQRLGSKDVVDLLTAWHLTGEKAAEALGVLPH